jgi:hypothetical protein
MMKPPVPAPGTSGKASEVRTAYANRDHADYFAVDARLDQYDAFPSAERPLRNVHATVVRCLVQ